MYSELVDWWNKYEEPATKIRVVLDTVSGAATAEHSEMLADAESGDSRFDIYNLDNEWVPEFAAGHFIRSLRGQLEPRRTSSGGPMELGQPTTASSTRRRSPPTSACSTTATTWSARPSWPASPRSAASSSSPGG